GAIPIALIAILIDIGLRMLERKLDPTQKKKGPQPQTIN
nr:ABC transporter permease [Staphylococcus lugdunensis]